MIASILLSIALFSQSPDTLCKAEVLADRHPVALSAAPLRVETRAAIERSGAKELSEVLRTLPGVSIKDYGGAGGIKTVSLRGFGSQHTQISYDGICISELQNGQVDISRFDLDNLEAVSVTIGQGNEIFRSARSFAGAGILELRSARPVFETGKSSRTGIGLRLGQWQSFQGNINHSHKLSERSSLSVNGSALSSKGDYPYTVVNGQYSTTERRFGSEMSALRGEMSLYSDVGRTGTMTARLSGFFSERGLPGPVILYTQDPTEHLWDRDLRADVIWNASPSGRLRAEAKASVSWKYNRYTDSSPVYPVLEDERFSQMEYYLSGVAMWSFSERLRLSCTQDLAYGTLDTSFPDCVYPRRLTSLTAAALQYSAPGFTLTGSLLGTWIGESVSSGEPAPVRKHLSPSLSAVWNPAGMLYLRAGWRDSFRTPTFNDLYYSKIGNTALRPETASQFNVGASWTLTRGHFDFEIDLDIYHNDVKDKIIATPTMFIWRMRNLGQVSMTGADLGVRGRYSFDRGFVLNARASYSYQYAVDVTDPESKSWKNQIAYTPRNSGSALLSLETPWGRVSYTLVAVGERYSLDQNKASNRLAPYWDHGLSVGRDWTLRGFRLTVSAEALNLTGTNYEIIKCYPMPGRCFRLTVKIGGRE